MFNSGNLIYCMLSAVDIIIYSVSQTSVLARY